MVRRFLCTQVCGRRPWRFVLRRCPQTLHKADLMPQARPAANQEFVLSGGDEQPPDLVAGLGHDAVVPAPVAPTPVAPRGARGTNQIKWACFSYAPVNRGGLHVGWGGTCSQHFDEGCSLPCKKQWDKGELSDEECIIRTKMWLLAGCALPADNNRKTHIQINPRSFADLQTEAELDAQLAAFLAA